MVVHVLTPAASGCCDVSVEYFLMMVLLWWLRTAAERQAKSHLGRRSCRVWTACRLAFVLLVLAGRGADANMHKSSRTPSSYFASHQGGEIARANVPSHFPYGAELDSSFSSSSAPPPGVFSDCNLIPQEWLDIIGANDSTSPTGCCLYAGDGSSCDANDYGIQCSQANDTSSVFVTIICLPGHGLTGELPLQLANMTQLHYLDLSQNQLTGTLPPSWENIRQLHCLDLSQNLLVGTLPPSWGNMPQLQTLYLDQNQLTGALPPSWENMPLLQTVNLGRNQLSGTLPPSWTNMTHMQMLSLLQNKLTGTLPASWANMTQLQFLDLSDNQLTGTLPPSWENMPLLQTVNLDRNQLSGTLPPSWTNMTQLMALNLAKNLLTGTLPTEWSNMQLGTLYLERNQLTGPLPPSWTNMLQLQELIIFQNQLTGTLPPSWANMTQLQELSLSQNQLVGTLPSSWANMPQLETFAISQNQLTGTLPLSWTNMTQLVSLDLSQNQLKGTLPASMPGVHINLNHNQLSGTLPSSWGSTTELVTLELSQNQLSGTLPSSWANMTQLQTLDLSQNQLKGTLPPSWVNMIRLQVVDLSSNQLNGTLPPSWVNLTNLISVQLADNHLSGELYAWLGTPFESTVLSTLSLRSNSFNGDVPCGIIGVPSLATLDLSNNNLVVDLCDAAVNVSQPLLLVLNGNTVRSLPPQLFSTPNSNLCLYMSNTQLTVSFPSEVLGPRCIVVSGNALSGPMPSVVDAQLFDVSLTNASGPLPCIQSSANLTLVISRTNISSLPDPAACTMPSVVRLLMAGVRMAQLPLDMGQLLPNMTWLVASSCRMVSAPMPIFAAERLQVLDLSLNDFVGQFRSRMATDAQYINLSPLFGRPEKLSVADLCPLTNPACMAQLSAAAAENQSVQAIAIFRSVDYPCPNNDIIVALGYFSLATAVFSFLYTGTAAENSAVPYTFTQTDIMGSYRATLLAASPAAGPVPAWNNTLFPLEQLLDATLVVDLGLQTGYLVFGVPYILRVEFFFMSDNYIYGQQGGLFIDRCPATSHVTRAPLVAGSCGSPLLMGVNGTTQCAGCPELATCDGGITFVTSNTWRLSASTLPLYLCTGKGCVIGGGTGTACADGYGGPACDVCSEGFGNSFGSCAACWPTAVSAVVVAVGVLVGLLVLTVAVVQSCKENSGTQQAGLRTELMSSAAAGIRLLSNHFSLSGPIVNMALFHQLHPAAQSAVHAQAAPGSLSLMRVNVVRCLFALYGFNANTQLALSVAALGGLTGLEIVLVKYMLRRGGKVAAAVAVAQLLFMTILTHAAQLLQYDHFAFFDMTAYLLDPSGAAGSAVVKDIHPLVTDRTIDRADNGAFIAFALLTIGVVGAGLPLTFVLVYRRAGPEYRSKFRYLTKKYRPEVWFWEAVIALRKAASTVLVCALFAYPVNQVYGYIAVITLYLFGHEAWSPVTSPWLLLSDRVSCAAAIATASVLLFTDGYGSAALGSGLPGAVIVALQVVSVGCVIYAHVRETLHGSPTLRSAVNSAIRRTSNWSFSETELQEHLHTSEDQERAIEEAREGKQCCHGLERLRLEISCEERKNTV